MFFIILKLSMIIIDPVLFDDPHEILHSFYQSLLWNGNDIRHVFDIFRINLNQIRGRGILETC